MVGNFNVQTGETHLGTFLYQHELVNINKEATCYEKPGKPTCIDFSLSNSPRNFFKTNTIFTELSAFHKLVLSVFKTTFPKSKSKEIVYRKFKNFSEENLIQELRINLTKDCVKTMHFLKTSSYRYSK